MISPLSNDKPTIHWSLPTLQVIEVHPSTGSIHGGELYFREDGVNTMELSSNTNGLLLQSSEIETGLVPGLIPSRRYLSCVENKIASSSVITYFCLDSDPLIGDIVYVASTLATLFFLPPHPWCVDTHCFMLTSFVQP